MRREYKQLRKALEAQITSNSEPTEAFFAAPELPAPPSLNAVPIMRSALKKRFTRQSMGIVRDFDELRIALQDQLPQITFDDDIIAKENLRINHDITINFNGYSLVSDHSLPGAKVFEISRGEVTLTGVGKVFAMGEDSTAIKLSGAMSAGVPNYTVLTIDEGVRIYAPDGTGVLVASNLGAAYGVKLYHRGKILAKNGIRLSHTVLGYDLSQPEFYLKDGSQVIADENNGVALSSEGLGNWQIGAAKILGAKGFSIAAGKAKLFNTTISAKYAAIEATLAPNHPRNRRLPIQLKIDGGTFVSGSEYALTGSCRLEQLQIDGGEFWGTEDGILPKLLRNAERKDVMVYKGTKTLDLEPISVPENFSEWSKMPVHLTPIKSNDYKTEPEDSPEALRSTLLQAVEDLRQLQAKDYISGFEKFSKALRNAESVLANSTADLETIRNAAEKLLAAMDELETMGKSTMSDDELDELFENDFLPEDFSEEKDLDFVDFDLAESEPSQSADSAPKWINELEPAGFWTTGTTLIDEAAPFYDPETVRRRHAMQMSGASSWWKSFSVGLHAGLAAFRKTRTQTHF